MFRRECFEVIGGYQPIQLGGVDLVAVLSARMKGWQTRTFLEKSCVHHRQMGTANRSALLVAFKGGQGDYLLGGHPLWEASRCVYQMKHKPIVVGGILRLIGFLGAWVSRREQVVPRELVAFRRAEQMRRLRKFVKHVVSFRPNTKSVSAGQLKSS